MEMKDNPLLQQEDYAKGYRESIERLKNNPHLIMFDKLCFETFNSEIGKKFIEHVTKTYLVPSLVNREAPNYDNLVIWADGFKDAFRMILQAITSHEQRITAEGNK